MNQSNDNPFAVLGLPQRFDLDPDDLHRRFLSASAANHPDRYTDPDQQQDAAQRSAQINDAYRRLADPELRAKTLLTLTAHQAAWDEKALPQELLMEVLEIREQLEQALADHDAPTLARLRDWAHQQKADYLDSIARLFKTLPTQTDPIRNQSIQQIQTNLNALRYAQRMLDQIPHDHQ